MRLDRSSHFETAPGRGRRRIELSEWLPVDTLCIGMPFYVLLGSFARVHSHILILARTVIRSRTHLSVAIPVVRVREGVRAISLGVHSALPVSQCQPTAQMQCQFEGALKIKATQPPAQGPARL